MCDNKQRQIMILNVIIYNLNYIKLYFIKLLDININILGNKDINGYIILFCVKKNKEV